MPERWKPSVTVAAIAERNGRYLFVEERTADGLRLNNPAGHLDPGESLIQAVSREALEETAYAFQPQALVGVYLLRTTRPGGHDITYLRFAFAGTVGDLDTTRKLDRGIVRALWLTPDEVRASASRHRNALVLQCVEEHLAGRRYPLEMLHAHASLFADKPARKATAD